MGHDFLRVFKELNIEEVKKHLLIWGDLTSDCASCRKLGINAFLAKSCPECGIEFKYVTSRRLDQHPGERFHLVRRMQEKRPDLLFIDYTDYTKLLGQKQARDFFG